MDKHITELRSIEVEQATLGGLLTDPMALYDVRAFLRAEDFSWEPHGKIYQAIIAVSKDGEPDLLLVHDELERRNMKVGYKDTEGFAYIARLPMECPDSVNTAYYARKVRDYADRRALLKACEGIARAAYDAESAKLAVAQSASLLEGVTATSGTGLEPTSALVDGYIPSLTEWLDGERDVWGIPTGIHDLDELTGGLERGEFVIVAGRPGMGKSALVAQIARHVAETGLGVAFFSLEMSQRQIITRLMCAGARVDSHAVKRGRVTESERMKLWDELGKVHDLPIWWLCAGGQTLQDITALVAKLSLRVDLGLVIVDYIQLMRSSGENQNIRVSKISQGLKDLAMKFDICVLGASQLSRAIEHRSPPIPMLSDLRDSGSLEQDADKIIFLHRKDDGTADVRLSKNRNGRADVGMQSLVFLETYAIFANRAHEAAHE